MRALGDAGQRRREHVVALGLQRLANALPTPTAVPRAVHENERRHENSPASDDGHIIDRSRAMLGAHAGRRGEQHDVDSRRVSMLATLCIALFDARARRPAPAPPLDARASDPVVMGWMVGAPPPRDKLVRFEDDSWPEFPQRRWSFSHIRELMPTQVVARGNGAVAELPRAERADIDAVTFRPIGRDDTMTWAQSLDANYTDGILILHRGRIVYERYFGVAARRPPAHRVFGHEVVRRDAGGHAHRRRCARRRRDRRELSAGAREERHRRRDDSAAARHDDGPRLHRGLRRSEVAGLGSDAGRRLPRAAAGLQRRRVVLRLLRHADARRGRTARCSPTRP